MSIAHTLCALELPENSNNINEATNIVQSLSDETLIIDNPEQPTEKDMQNSPQESDNSTEEKIDNNADVNEAPISIINEEQNTIQQENGAVTEANKEVSKKIIFSFDSSITPKAASIVNQFSPEAQADFEDFKAYLAIQLPEILGLSELITKYETIYKAYADFKGNDYQLWLDFFIFGEEYALLIKEKIDESNKKFKESLSEDNKQQFEEYVKELTLALNKGLVYVFSELGQRKLAGELIEIDTNRDLMINLRID